MSLLRRTGPLWFALGFALVIACGTRSELPVGGAGTGSDADGGSDGGVDGGTYAPSPTTFVLENGGVAPIVAGDRCNGTWLSLSRDDRPVLVDRSCACACSMPDICGCPAICRISERLIVPGETDTQGWDGVQAIVEAGASCYDATVPAPGASFVAEACWNVDDQSGARSCVSKEFAYGAQESVRLIARPAAVVPVDTVVELTNDSEQAVDIVVNRCGSQGFFEVVRDAESITLSTFCPCSCDADYGLAGCPTCGACAPDVIQTLQPGETKQHTWNGKFWYTYPSTCQARYDMPAGVQLEAKVCWTVHGSSVQRCTTGGFAHGQAEPVQLTIR